MGEETRKWEKKLGSGRGERRRGGRRKFGGGGEMCGECKMRGEEEVEEERWRRGRAIQSLALHQ